MCWGDVWKQMCFSSVEGCESAMPAWVQIILLPRGCYLPWIAMTDSPSESRRSPAGFGCPKDCLLLAATAWTNVLSLFVATCDDSYYYCEILLFFQLVHHDPVVYLTNKFHETIRKRDTQTLDLYSKTLSHRVQRRQLRDKRLRRITIAHVYIICIDLTYAYDTVNQQVNAHKPS
jgi:hypothetical protein